ncbi:MAG: DUF6790 family protein [Pirellulales bacterium]
MLATALEIFFGNFGFAMLILALVLAAALTYAQRSRPQATRLSFAEQTFRWVSLLAAGFTGLYTFVFHVFFPASAAAHIGWATSPFQYEVGMADLTIGVLGVLAFRGSLGFRLATTLAAITWLGGDAVGHVRQIVEAQNFAPGNAGSWLWVDILVPLVMAVSLAACWRQTHAAPRRRSAARRELDRTAHAAY